MKQSEKQKFELQKEKKKHVQKKKETSQKIKYSINK